MNPLKWLRNRELNKLLNKVPQPPRYPGFERAQNFGVFVVAQSAQEAAARLLVKALEQEGKQVKVLAYYPDKELSGGYDWPAFTKKELNWLGKPNNETTAQFLRDSYAVVFDFTQEDLYPLHFVRAQLKSSLLVGFGEQSQSWSDLHINQAAEKDANQVVQEALKYLKLINSKPK